MGFLEVFRLIITCDPDNAQSAVGRFEVLRQSETSCSHGLDIDEYDIRRKQFELIHESGVVCLQTYNR